MRSAPHTRRTTRARDTRRQNMVAVTPPEQAALLASADAGLENGGSFTVRNGESTSACETQQRVEYEVVDPRGRRCALHLLCTQRCVASTASRSHFLARRSRAPVFELRPFHRPRRVSATMRCGMRRAQSPSNEEAGVHDSRKQGNDSISSLLRYQRWMMCACASTNLECISNVCTVLRKVRRSSSR